MFDGCEVVRWARGAAGVRSGEVYISVSEREFQCALRLRESSVGGATGTTTQQCKFWHL